MTDTSGIAISIDGDTVRINDTPFDVDEYGRIRTRILRNTFDGEYSHLTGMGGMSVVRDGDVLQLAKPATTPKESWTYAHWVHESDGWTVYAEGTLDEWKTVFNVVERELD